MTRKKPTKRRAKHAIDELKDDVGAGDDVDVNIRTWGVDLVENVDADEADDDVLCIRDGRVLTAARSCVVEDCDESAIGPDVDRCITHYDGDRDTVRGD